MQSRSNPLPVSVWQYKPWWCQPWSILLTGVGLIGGSWFLLHLIWVTILVAIPVLTWMVFFLLVYPKLMAQSGLLQTELEQTELKQTELEQMELDLDSSSSGIFTGTGQHRHADEQEAESEHSKHRPK